MATYVMKVSKSYHSQFPVLLHFYWHKYIVKNKKKMLQWTLYTYDVKYSKLWQYLRYWLLEDKRLHKKADYLILFTHLNFPFYISIFLFRHCSEKDFWICLILFGLCSTTYRSRNVKESFICLIFTLILDLL